MLTLEISIRHPWKILLTIGFVVGFFAALQYVVNTHRLPADIGGSDRPAASVVRDAEERMRRERIIQSVLSKREEILRYELRLLTLRSEEQSAGWSAEEEAQWKQSRDQLLLLMKDQKASEERIREYLRQIWEAEGRAIIAAPGSAEELPALIWPVPPAEGISAFFMDSAYEERFGIPHRAIDIPVDQNSAVRAAADGIVESVSDNGLGFNSLVIRHRGGSTLYGHLQSFLVEEGQFVRRSDVIGLSGGQPGTPGAGAISTGPHLHFEVIIDGTHIDPLTVLPQININ
ncbi:MAG: M23 family metallopeptidase [Candidatus Peregrinibacteria bacterium]